MEGHCTRVVSFPVHCTLSRRIRPVPVPKPSTPVAIAPVGERGRGEGREGGREEGRKGEGGAKQVTGAPPRD